MEQIALFTQNLRWSTLPHTCGVKWTIGGAFKSKKFYVRKQAINKRALQKLAKYLRVNSQNKQVKCFGEISEL